MYACAPICICRILCVAFISLPAQLILWPHSYYMPTNHRTITIDVWMVSKCVLIAQVKCERLNGPDAKGTKAATGRQWHELSRKRAEKIRETLPLCSVLMACVEWHNVSRNSPSPNLIPIWLGEMSAQKKWSFNLCIFLVVLLSLRHSVSICISLATAHLFRWIHFKWQLASWK